MSTNAGQDGSPARLGAFAELVRLPNVFTAMADLFLGYLLTHDDLERWWVFVLLLAASSLLYSAGMVLNDVFDREIDAAERPHRPIPSGRVPVGLAKGLGFGLLLGGAGLGWTAGAFDWQARCGLVASTLAVMVLLYDRVLKRTPLAPLAMGACRTLNVLLGMSAAGAWHAIHWLVAAGVGVYIVGVTWFARTEARASNRWQLGLATLVMGGGLGLLAWFPSWRTADLPSVSAPRYALTWQPDAAGAPAEQVVSERWYLFWSVLALLIGWRCVWAVIEPWPARVQMAVKHGLLSLIVIDAAACWAVRGPFWAAMILLLLLPAMLLGRWIYST